MGVVVRCCCEVVLWSVVGCCGVLWGVGRRCGCCERKANGHTRTFMRAIFLTTNKNLNWNRLGTTALLRTLIIITTSH